MEVDFLKNFRANVSSFIANNLANSKNEIRRLESLRKKFVSDFPINKIEEMPLERFTSGNHNRTSFCNRLENELKGLGDMHGSRVDKFGVYYSNQRGRYECAKKWSRTKDVGEGFINVKHEISQLLKDGNANNYNEICNNRISPLFKGKILSVYFPNKYLSVFSKDHVKNFLAALNMEYDYDLSIEENKLKLLLIKNYDERLNKFDNQLFMKFLYSSIYNYMNDEVVSDNSSYDEVEVVEMDYLNLIENNVGAPRKVNHTENEINKIIQGNKAEEIVLRFEQNKLHRLNKDDLAQKVEQVSKTKGDGLGYDILSFNELGEEIYIEVKSKRSFNNAISFYITENECRFLDKNPNSYVYYVFDVYGKPKIHIINLQRLKALGENWKVPVIYKINVQAQKWESINQ